MAQRLARSSRELLQQVSYMVNQVNDMHVLAAQEQRAETSNSAPTTASKPGSRRTHPSSRPPMKFGRVMSVRTGEIAVARRAARMLADSARRGGLDLSSCDRASRRNIRPAIRPDVTLRSLDRHDVDGADVGVSRE